MAKADHPWAKPAQLAPGDARPLAGVRVLDFSTLRPGPLASLMLAEGGAEVLRVERPGGDEMRAYAPMLGKNAANFALLNRGKRSLEIDLKALGAVERLKPLLQAADVLIEQFRPGVMDRLGLGWEAVKAINPGLIYCSISGFSSKGPLADVAGHDMNYLARAGILDLSADANGTPTLPPILAADVGGGAYPAVINVLMALLARARTGKGTRVDLAMADCLYPFAYWVLAQGFAGESWPRGGSAMLVGGSPRYQIWRTKDGRHLTAAPLEERFWKVFCQVIGLPEDLRNDSRDPEATKKGIAALIATRSAADWLKAFEGQDACVALVATLEEAVTSPAFAPLFATRKAGQDGRFIPAIPLPLAPEFLGPDEAEAPALGEANKDFLG
ncbi:MAG: CoA transferase [Rhodospirillales bacterium]|nr:CoA transferase [Rhodospirillales bacterium]